MVTSATELLLLMFLHILVRKRFENLLYTPDADARHGLLVRHDDPNQSGLVNTVCVLHSSISLSTPLEPVKHLNLES